MFVCCTCLRQFVTLCICCEGCKQYDCFIRVLAPLGFLEAEQLSVLFAAFNLARLCYSFHRFIYSGLLTVEEKTF